MSPRRHPVAKRSLISQIFEKMMNFQKNLVFSKIFGNWFWLLPNRCQSVSPNPYPYYYRAGKIT